MDPRRLLTFRAVARERSFSRAAAALGLTQPSVSHQIAQLEIEVGVTLLLRGPGGVRLTEAGETLLEHADEVAWRLQLADAQVADLASQARDELRVGCFPTALAAYLPAAVQHVRAARGSVRVLLSEVTPGALAPRLLSGEFDIAVSYHFVGEPGPDIAGARRVDLLHDSFFLGLPPDHPLADGAGPIPLTALADEDWLLPHADGFLARACRAAGFDPRIVAITQDPLTTRGLVRRGLGVGWVSGLLASESTGIVLRDVADPLPPREVFALLPPGRAHPLASVLIDALADAAAEFGAPHASRAPAGPEIS
jgi:DNA-binding transcriptional LysR family regulator